MKIQIFQNSDLGQVRIAQNEDREVLFCAADVCKALSYSNSRDALAKHVSNEDVAKCDTPTNGGMQQMTYVNESGLYSLIFGSKQERAKLFKKWVTSEVLPSIRKTGGYLSSAKEDTPEEIMARALTIAQATLAKREERLKRLESEAEANAPKVLFAQAVETSKGSCLIAELAKILQQNGVSIGQNRLFAWLRDNGYLCSKGESRNQPTQRAMELGLFEIIKRTINNPNGSVLVTATTKVTGKGQVYFVNKFIGKAAAV